MVQTPAFDAALALSRFGLGSGLSGTAAVSDARAVLHDEINAGAPVPQGDLQATPDLLTAVYQYQAQKRMDRKAAGDTTDKPDMQDGVQGDMKPDMQAGMTDDKPDAGGRKKRDPDLGASPVIKALFTEFDARFNGTVKSPVIGFNERMAMFWFNHFAVSVKKSQPVAATAGAYEREAIRPHIFGKFHDMLVAVETHPTMLLYLDNAQSVGPQSLGAKFGKRGLNENLAREIFELHTLGVGTGYTQADVTSFARIITGWSVSTGRKAFRNMGDPGTFAFNDRIHEPGAQIVMGKTYAEGGQAQGLAVLADLARHPATAKHIATMLARHFVADDPPPALVARLADTFTRTDGDLGEVSRALISSDEAWSPQLVKIRSPLEYVCAVLRATGAPIKPKVVASVMNAMGEPLWQPPGPNGFPDTIDAWASPEGLSARMDFISTLAQQASQDVDPRAFAQSRLGPLLSDATLQAISRAETHAQGLSLAFLSPEFMRR